MLGATNEITVMAENSRNCALKKTGIRDVRMGAMLAIATVGYSLGTVSGLPGRERDHAVAGVSRRSSIH